MTRLSGRSSLLRVLAIFFAFALVAAACGSDGDEGAADEPAPAADDGGDGGEEEPMDDGDGLATEGVVEIATGTTLDLGECPDDWSATTGVDGDEIRLGISLPQSGSLAAFGPIADGMAAYFDWVNANDPIDGKQIVLVIRDDAYESGRTVANVEEMIDTDEIFAFVSNIGSPNNAAVRPILNEACIPHALASTGLPIWGDPATFPWTIGGLLPYNTEARLWCENVVAELGEGATVAGLFMNNDFGAAYQAGVEGCAEDGLIELVSNEVHEAAAPDITNEMTNMISSDADAFIFGSTGAFCPQATGGVAGSAWRPLIYMSNTCSNLAAFFAPVQDVAALLASEGSAVRMAANTKNFTDPVYAEDEAVILGRQILEDAGLTDVGSQTTGIAFAFNAEQALRRALELHGELNRVTFQSALWNMNHPNIYALDGMETITDGTNDAYVIEAARIEEIIVTEGGELSFNPVSELISVEGETGSVTG